MLNFILQSGRGRGGGRSSHQLGVHPLMASVGNYQHMAARWYAGAMGQLDRRSLFCISSPVAMVVTV